MEATGVKQPVTGMRRQQEPGRGGGGNGDADGGSRGNAVQCLNSPAVFLAFVEIYDPNPLPTCPTPPALYSSSSLPHTANGASLAGAGEQNSSITEARKWSDLDVYRVARLYSGIAAHPGPSWSGMHSSSPCMLGGVCWCWATCQ